MNIYEKMKTNGLFIEQSEVGMICEKYDVIELSVFGSCLRDDFNENK